MPERLLNHRMPTFTLAGVTYDYLAPKLEGDPEDVNSWECGNWPKVEAAPQQAEASVYTGKRHAGGVFARRLGTNSYSAWW
jgi:hypothetical protein